MATFTSVTYTFTNGTNADATQVNQNFTDIINGLSDGTKDIRVNDAVADGDLAVGTTTHTGHLTVYNAAVNTDASYYGMYNYNIKTLGATDAGDEMAAIFNYAEFNQAGGTFNNLQGVNTSVQLTDGTVANDFTGIRISAKQTGGTVTDDVFGLRALVDQDAGTISGDGYGAIIDCDYDGTVTGDTYMCYLNEKTGVDYGFYQNGTADNVLGGILSIGTIKSGATQAAAGAAADEIWKTNGHATLPDNVILIGV